jgi:hypothetical protein
VLPGMSDVCVPILLTVQHIMQGKIKPMVAVHSLLFDLKKQQFFYPLSQRMSIFRRNGTI